MRIGDGDIGVGDRGGDLSESVSSEECFPPVVVVWRCRDDVDEFVPIGRMACGDGLSGVGDLWIVVPEQ